MARAHGSGPDGVERDLIGQPLHLRPGPASGLHFVEQSTMTRAPHDGTYLLDGYPFRMFAGQPLPPGAVIRDPESAPVPAQPEATGAGPAPENAARGKAPATKAKAKGSA